MTDRQTCPTCGSPVNVCGMPDNPAPGSMHTTWYEPVKLADDPEAVERGARAIAEFQSNYHEPRPHELARACLRAAQDEEGR